MISIFLSCLSATDLDRHSRIPRGVKHRLIQQNSQIDNRIATPFLEGIEKKHHGQIKGILKKIPSDQLDDFTRLAVPLIVDTAPSCTARLKVLTAFMEIQPLERENFSIAFSPVIKKIDEDYRRTTYKADAVGILSRVLPGERAEVGSILTIFFDSMRLRSSYDSIACMQLILNDVRPSERLGFVQCVSSLLSLANDWDKLEFLKVFSGLPIEERFSFSEAIRPFFERQGKPDKMKVVKVMATLLAAERVEFLSNLFVLLDHIDEGYRAGAAEALSVVPAAERTQFCEVIIPLFEKDVKRDNAHGYCKCEYEIDIIQALTKIPSSERVGLLSLLDSFKSHISYKNKAYFISALGTVPASEREEFCKLFISNPRLFTTCIIYAFKEISAAERASLFTLISPLLNCLYDEIDTRGIIQIFKQMPPEQGQDFVQSILPLFQKHSGGYEAKNIIEALKEVHISERAQFMTLLPHLFKVCDGYRTDVVKALRQVPVSDREDFCTLVVPFIEQGRKFQGDARSEYNSKMIQALVSVPIKDLPDLMRIVYPFFKETLYPCDSEYDHQTKQRTVTIKHGVHAIYNVDLVKTFRALLPGEWESFYTLLKPFFQLDNSKRYTEHQKCILQEQQLKIILELSKYKRLANDMGH